MEDLKFNNQEFTEINQKQQKDCNLNSIKKIPEIKFKYRNSLELKKINFKLKDHLLSENNNNNFIYPIKSNQNLSSTDRRFSNQLKIKSNLPSEPLLPKCQTQVGKNSIKFKDHFKEEKLIENKVISDSYIPKVRDTVDSPKDLTVNTENKEIIGTIENIETNKIEKLDQKGFPMLSYDNNNINNQNQWKYNYDSISMANPIKFSIDNQNDYSTQTVKVKKSMMLLSPKILRRVLLKNKFYDNQDKSIIESNNNIITTVKSTKKLRKRSITLPNITVHMTCSIFEANAEEENDESLIIIKDNKPEYHQNKTQMDKITNNFENPILITNQKTNKTGILIRDKKSQIKKVSHVGFRLSEVNPQGKKTAGLKNEFIGKNKFDENSNNIFNFGNNNTDRENVKISEEKEIMDFEESSFNESYLSNFVSNSKKSNYLMKESPNLIFQSKQLSISTNINLASRKSPSCACLIF